jgi:hypothetical protein
MDSQTSFKQLSAALLEFSSLTEQRIRTAKRIKEMIADDEELEQIAKSSAEFLGIDQILFPKPKAQVSAKRARTDSQAGDQAKDPDLQPPKGQAIVPPPNLPEPPKPTIPGWKKKKNQKRKEKAKEERKLVKELKDKLTKETGPAPEPEASSPR